MDKFLLPLINSRLNLRIKISLTTLSLLLLAFIAITAPAVWVSRSTLTRTLQDNLLSQAEQFANSIRSYLMSTQSMAVDLGAVAEVAKLDSETSKRIIEQMLRQNQEVFGSTIAYEPYQFDPSVYAWAPYYSRTPNNSLAFTQLGVPENNYYEQAWYRLAKESQKIILSPPYFDEGGAKIWMVTWSVPFFDEKGQVKGVATTDIAFSQTQEIIRQIEIGEDGYAFLIDSQGTLLGIGGKKAQYKIMQDTMFLSNNTSDASEWNEVIKEMTAGKSGFVGVTDPVGTEIYVAYLPIGLETGWSLGLALPQTELLQPVVQLQNRLIIISVVILFLATIVMLLLSQSITHPLQEIISWANSFSQEKLRSTESGVIQTPPLQIKTNDEIEELAHAFNQMSGELTTTLNTLEQQVSNRTKALQASLEVSRRLSTATSPRQLAVEVVEQVQAAFGYYHAHIYFFDEQNENLVMTAGTGQAGAAMLAAGHSIPKGRGLVGRAAETNEAVLVEDVTRSIGWLPNPLLPDTKSEAAVPIAVGSQVLGVLDVQQNIVNGLGENDIVLLQSLANQVAISLQNVRAYERAATQAEMEATINYLSQRIQRAGTVEETLQIALQEVSQVLGAKRALVTLSAQDENPAQA
ncbi:MAG: hypothetical protein Fur0016_10370 [Anaerolineales bacterium]